MAATPARDWRFVGALTAFTMAAALWPAAGHAPATTSAQTPGGSGPRLFLPIATRAKVLARADLDAWTLHERPRFVDLALDEPRGLLWGVTATGAVWRWTVATGELRTFTSADGLPFAAVGTVAVDKAGSTWFAPRQTHTDADGAGRAGIARLAPDGTWRRILAIDGLPHGTVYSIEADRAGDLWMGTFAGPARPAGVGRWDLLTRPDHENDCLGYGCPSVALAIAPDDRGGVWFASSRRLTHVEAAGRWTDVGGGAKQAWGPDGHGGVWFELDRDPMVRHADGAGRIVEGIRLADLALSDLRGIGADAQGNLWLTGSSAVVRVGASGAIERFGRSDELPIWEFGILTLDSAGRPWLAGAAALGHLDAQGAWQALRTNSLQDGDWVMRLAIDAAGTKWLGLYEPTERRDRVPTLDADGRWTFELLPAESGPRAMVWDLAVDPSGGAWAALGSTLARLRRGGGHPIWSVDEFLPGGSITCVAVGQDGTVWFGIPGNDTPAGGVVAMPREGPWRRYSTADGLASDDVWAIALDERRGEVWVSGHGGTSVRTADGRWRAFRSPDGLTEAGIKAMLVDVQGNRWFAEDAGRLGRLDRDGGWTVFRSDPDVQASMGYSALAEDPDGSLWVATSHGARRLMPDGTWLAYRVPGPPYVGWEDIRDVEVDAHGAVWFGTRGGLAVLR